ncbi:hypothetical protein CAL7716_085270 [Calothrix sp. PCC 7716]|nr:hypothetical protein CAL7716_085270 [Calothrix sp. PCC 7716]
MANITAKITPVAIGLFSIDGLRDEEGRYYIGVPQITGEFQFDSRQASRAFKSLLGKDCLFTKLKTSLNPKAINAIPLVDFEKLLVELALKGNTRAIELVRGLAGLSLHQLFSDAFKVKFEQEERQDYLVKQQQSIRTRRLLTDAIRDYSARHPERSDNYRKFIYNNCTDKLYRALFGKPASKLEEERSCVGKLRSSFSASELVVIERHEDYATRLIDKLDVEPTEAIAQAVDFYS